MGYPKKHRGRRKMGSKKEEQEKKIKEIIKPKMDSIQKVKSITLWIFIVPFFAINACLILITQFHGLFHPEDIIHNTIPYIDGGASISRTARVFPTMVFKYLNLLCS